MLEVPLKSILTESLCMKMMDIRLEDYLAHNPDCLKCEYMNQCGAGCRGLAIGEGTADYFAVDEETCYFFKGGYPDKVKAVADEAINKLHV